MRRIGAAINSVVPGLAKEKEERNKDGASSSWTVHRTQCALQYRMLLLLQSLLLLLLSLFLKYD